MVALAPILMLDTFDRTDVNGWTVMNSGHQWLNPAGTNSSDTRLDASGGFGTITLASGDTSSFKSTVYANAANTDVAGVLCRFKVGLASKAGPVLRLTDSGNDYYCCRLDTNDRFNICVVIDGTLTELSNVTPTIATNTYYWVRFESTTTNLRARMWAEGAAEPGSWDIDIAESAAAGNPQSGDPGFYYQGNSAADTITVATWVYYDPAGSLPALPVTDAFTDDTTEGFGLANGLHCWEGAFADDPGAYASANRHLGTKSSGIGNITVLTTEELYGIIGPIATDCTVQVKVQVPSGSAFFSLGIRGTIGYASGLAEITDGYALEFNATADVVILKRRQSSGAWTTIDTSSAFTINLNTDYWLRLEAEGTTIRGRIWADGDPMPSTWNVLTSSSPIASGRAFIMEDNSSASSIATKIDSFSFTDLPSIVSVPLITGTAATLTPTIKAVVAAPVATATGDVKPITQRILVPIATATGAVVTPTVVLASATPTATATGNAPNPTIRAIAITPVATATGAALTPTIQAIVNPPLATATGAVIVPVLRIYPPVATASGLVLTPTVKAVSNAPLLTGSGTALTPTIQAVVKPPVSTATGAVLTPTILGVVSAPVSTGTGSALIPTIKAVANAPLLTGTGSAITPTVDAIVEAPLMSASGSVLTPTVLGTAEFVKPPVATATGVVLDPVLRAVVSAPVATAVGDVPVPFIKSTSDATVILVPLLTASGSVIVPSILFVVIPPVSAATGSVLNPSIAGTGEFVKPPVATASGLVITSSVLAVVRPSVLPVSAAIVAPVVSALTRVPVASASGLVLVPATRLIVVAPLATDTVDLMTPLVLGAGIFVKPPILTMSADVLVPTIRLIVIPGVATAMGAMQLPVTPGTLVKSALVVVSYMSGSTRIDFSTGLVRLSAIESDIIVSSNDSTLRQTSLSGTVTIS